MNSVEESRDRWEKSRLEDGQVLSELLHISTEETTLKSISQHHREYSLLKTVGGGKIRAVTIILIDWLLESRIHSISSSNKHLVTEFDTLRVASGSRSVGEHEDVFLIRLLHGNSSLSLLLSTLFDQVVQMVDGEIDFLADVLHFIGQGISILKTNYVL